MPMSQVLKCHRSDRHARRPDGGGWQPLVSLSVRLAGGGGMMNWLRESASLTARLQCHGPTTVMRVRQCRALADRDERWFVGGALARKVMVREVVLKVSGEPWVFAHTVANAPALRLLRRAGRNALAVVLFSDPRVLAGPLHFRQLDARHPLHRAAGRYCAAIPSTPSPQGLMARRAEFRRGKARLLVTEVFLPAIQGDRLSV